MDIDSWKLSLDVTQKLFVPFNVQGWMQPALHQDLVTTQRDSLTNFIKQLRSRQQIPLATLWRSVEGAEITNSRADVCVVDVAIDVVRTIGLWVEFLRDLVCGRSNRGQITALK